MYTKEAYNSLLKSTAQNIDICKVWGCHHS